jgi:hypothetical protein
VDIYVRYSNGIAPTTEISKNVYFLECTWFMTFILDRTPNISIVEYCIMCPNFFDCPNEELDLIHILNTFPLKEKQFMQFASGS